MHGHGRKANRDPARRNIRNLAAGIRRHAHRIDTSQRTRRVCPSWRRRWRGRRRRRLDADERTTARPARQRDMVDHPGRRHLPWVRKRRDHRSTARHGRHRGHDGPHAQATRQRAIRAVLRRRFPWLESNHSRGKASGRCRTLLLGNQVRLLTDDDDVTMFQATLLRTATETEDQPQKDRSHHGKEAEYSTGSTA